VTSPGNRGSPIICGFNTGQHSKIKLLLSWINYSKLHFFFLVFLDASDVCNVINFNLGTGGGTRQWEIKGITVYKYILILFYLVLLKTLFAVSQFKCGDEDNGGKLKRFLKVCTANKRYFEKCFLIALSLAVCPSTFHSEDFLFLFPNLLPKYVIFTEHLEICINKFRTWWMLAIF